MVIVTVEWEHMQRRRASLEVSDDATSEQVTELAVALAASGRAGHTDEILADAVGHVSWTAPDGRFGGRAQ